ncbi:MAG TPA: hypothetical protein VGN52_07185 [Burkholderiales bacterium]|jgi:hypothetical protein
MKIAKIALGLALTAATLAPIAALADVPGRHPGYLRALSDLRAARWDLEHRAGDRVVNREEDLALAEIDRAIAEAQRAAIEDGKNRRARPPEDARMTHGGRLHHAVESLRAARGDVAREEDNPQARGLRNRIVEHIDAALRHTERAIREVELRR